MSQYHRKSMKAYLPILQEENVHDIILYMTKLKHGTLSGDTFKKLDTTYLCVLQAPSLVVKTATAHACTVKVFCSLY